MLADACRPLVNFLAPAKINLSLIVKGRRADGFHEIETVIVPISLCDSLEIARHDEEGLEFTCDDPSVPGDEMNLVVRATRLFCSAAGREPHLRIHLRKVIPHGAGLGGGSSDAATTLLALNTLFETALSWTELAELGGQLGSDVPVFLYGSAALCRGRGEQIEPLHFPHPLPLLLVKPPFGVPTPWAYGRWQKSLEIPGVSYAPQPFAWGELCNDLERPVFEKHLFLAVLKGWLLAQAEVAGALMSGSGSTLFAVLHEATGAAPLASRAAQEFGQSLWCKAVETKG